APLTGFDTTAGNAITGAAGAASGAGSAAGSALPSLLPMGAQGAAALLSGNPALGQQAGGPLGSAGQDVVNPSYLASPGAAPAPALTPTAAAPTQEGAPAGSSGGGATNAAGTGSGGSLDNFLKQISGVAPLALALGGMGANALMKPAIPGVNQGTSGINPQSALGQQLGIAQDVQGQIQPQLQVASSLQATANPLVNAPVTGQLPAAVAASFQNQLANQITAIKSQYASLGEPGSTAEQLDIQNAQNAMQSQMANLLLQYGTQGLSTEQAAQNATTLALNAAQLPSQTYGNIANLELASDQQLSQAITNIASAAAGSQRPLAA
ncbi:MAG: hypothetical protein ACRD27_04945, partial [Terracidiphilus sp.]